MHLTIVPNQSSITGSPVTGSPVTGSTTTVWRTGRFPCSAICCYLACGCLAVLCLVGAQVAQGSDAVLPGTAKLDQDGDLTQQMVAGIDRFLLRQLETSVASRAQFWHREYSTDEAYTQSVASNRQRLNSILGLNEERVATTELQWSEANLNSRPIARAENFEVFKVSWRAFANVWGEGLLLVPTHRSPIADVVAIPDADQLPEQVAGLVEGIPADSQFARRLVANGCRVLVPVLISREREKRAAPGREGRTTLTNREYLYRPAFELGRHLIGCEVDKIRACIDWFQSSADSPRPVGVIGYGEGGLLALYSSAVDPRVDVACVSGYFGSRQDVWQEPIDRNLFGILEQFGDAEVASLIAPRGLIVEGSTGPTLEVAGEGGAPASLVRQSPAAVRGEWQRLLGMVRKVPALGNRDPNRLDQFHLEWASESGFCDSAALASFLSELVDEARLSDDNEPIDIIEQDFDVHTRQRRQLRQLDEYIQQLLRESPYTRTKFMERLDTSSLATFQRSVEPYREYFRDEVIGSYDLAMLPASPRTRLIYDEPTWCGYEVVLDVFPDVIAYGILCLPKGIDSGERRPVVVCQHGLEGRPQQVITGDHRAYHDFAAKLAERGFVTFAPQNLYIFRDQFRTLQRKANPLKKTLFSIMVPQHQQIVDWLQSLPYVDPERIAFYGLSYGGKSAMRIPPLVPDYCLSICSADFNDWVRKCASTRSPYSYVWTGEYEIFEWNLGSTFNYAEMAALIAPRPFMVERGHFDGVAPDEWVAAEFGKVRRLYQAQLGIGDVAEIEWFVGPHTINGKGTFNFLHKHLRWPLPR